MTSEHHCPQLEASEWEGKELRWDGKPFYRTKYRSLFHIPLNIGGVTARAMREIEARSLVDDPLMMIALEESAFHSTLLVSMKEAAEDLPVERLSGAFIARLFKGKYSQTRKWIAEMRRYMAERGENFQRLLFWYVTCPACAKKYGGAQTVILAQVG